MLRIGETLLGCQVRASRAQAPHLAGSEALEQENKQLRAQLACAEMERDIFKSAEHRPNVRSAFLQKTG